MAVYQQFSLATLRQQLLTRADGSPFWTDEEANAAINEALLMWNGLTGFWKGSVDITTTAGNWDYAVVPSLVFGTRVEYDGFPLAMASLADMDWGLPGWQGQTTATGGSVPTSVKIWLPMSIDLIAIWPADAVGGHTLTVNGVAQTPQLTSDTAFIDIGAEELNVILGYALHTLAFKEGGERFAATMAYFQDFLREAAEENDQLGDSAMFRQFMGTDEGRQLVVTRGKPTDYDQFGNRTP